MTNETERLESATDVSAETRAFGGWACDSPLDMIRECRKVLSMLTLTWSEAYKDEIHISGLVCVLNRLESSLEDIEAVVRARIHDPFSAGRNTGIAYAQEEYRRGFREGSRSVGRTGDAG